METAVHNALTYNKARDLYSTRNRDYSAYNRPHGCSLAGCRVSNRATIRCAFSLLSHSRWDDSQLACISETDIVRQLR